MIVCVSDRHNEEHTSVIVSVSDRQAENHTSVIFIVSDRHTQSAIVHHKCDLSHALAVRW